MRRATYKTEHTYGVALLYDGGCSVEPSERWKRFTDLSLLTAQSSAELVPLTPCTNIPSLLVHTKTTF